MTELEPCPYCGGELKSIGIGETGCELWEHPFNGCFLHRYTFGCQEFVASWNTRTAPPRIAELEAEVERLREALEKIAAPMSITVRKPSKMYKDLRADATRRIDVARAALAPKETIP